MATDDTENMGPVVDADGHVLEPLDTWQKYIDPQYRDRAVRLEHDDNGWEVLMFDNKPLNIIRGTLGALGGVGSDAAESEAFFTPGKRTYADGCPPGSYAAAPRLKVMDDEGIDISLLYPTVGIVWEGWVSVFLSPDMVARGWKHFNDPAFVRFWETVQELEMPVGFHVVLRDEPSWRDWISGEGDFGLFNFAFLAIDVMAAFTQMVSLGMFELYPRLKCTVLECGANWISAWLDRLDHKYEPLAGRSVLKMKPSEYFYRQCLVSADPDETLTARVIEHIGADYFVWASDYPHIDSDYGVAAKGALKVNFPFSAQCPINA